MVYQKRNIFATLKIQQMKFNYLFVFIFISSLLPAQKQYFQQHLDYKINVSLNDLDHSLKGDIQIVYKNNSPDVLDKIGIHLWPNAYKNKETAFAKQKLLCFPGAEFQMFVWLPPEAASAFYMIGQAINLSL